MSTPADTSVYKRLRWLKERIKTPPFGELARREAGYFLGQVQTGDMLSMPASRPLPTVGKHCHELRVRDENINWRIIYRIDATKIVIAGVFAKKSKTQQQLDFTKCKARLKAYDARIASGEEP
jgi:phage-related protein